jgi:UDP-glucose 6-dehydrogenase
MLKTAIVGYGKVGRSYHKVFPEAIVYDPYQPEGKNTSKEEVNDCDVAIVAVFTPHKKDGSLDISIVEEVIDWIDCPLIIIKSALQPGTTDMLVNKTGKRIAISVEYVGEGNYPVHFWKYPDQEDPRKHQMLVVGGADEVAEEAIQILWRRLSPDVKIHKVTALEAEIVKLVENSYPAMKVTFMNAMLSVAKKSESSFIRIHQAWNSDPRTDSMHVRAVEHERGWKSKCWDKDVPALAEYARSIGATDMTKLLNTVIEINNEHLKENDKS